jgi:predicted MFS family arabinose efflux permease
MFVAVYVPFYYLATFSRDIIGLSYSDSLSLLLVLNGVGVIGRLVPNFVADRIGPINVFIPTALASSVCVLCWMAVSSPIGLYLWAISYGFAAGGIQSLFPAGLSSLTTDLRKAGVRMGMVFTINSLATLIGPPIAGALIGAQQGRFFAAQAFSGVMLLIGTGFMVAARFAATKGAQGGWWVKV